MKKSQKERILDYLKIHKSITSLECVYNLKIVDLQHPIMELRREGYNIKDRWEKGQYNKYKVYELGE